MLVSPWVLLVTRWEGSSWSTNSFDYIDLIAALPGRAPTEAYPLLDGGARADAVTSNQPEPPIKCPRESQVRIVRDRKGLSESIIDANRVVLFYFPMTDDVTTLVGDRRHPDLLDLAWDLRSSLPHSSPDPLPSDPLRSQRSWPTSPPRRMVVRTPDDHDHGSPFTRSVLLNGRTCSQMAVLLPRPSLASFCGLAAATRMTRPNSSL